VTDTRPRLVPSAEERAVAERRLDALGLGAGEGFVLLSAGAPAGSAKAWPAERWVRLAALLARDPGLPCVAVCGPGEEPALAPLGAAGVRLVVAPPAGLRELAALAALARLVVTTDSGPRHVAAAVGAAVVCAMGPSDPRHTADHLERTRIVRDRVECGPCHRARCPLAGERREACMRLAPERLHVAALELLGYHPGSSSS
jgi:heptosyltransferase-2